MSDLSKFKVYFDLISNRFGAKNSKKLECDKMERLYITLFFLLEIVKISVLMNKKSRICLLK